jgi:hypothetical protein
MKGAVCIVMLGGKSQRYRAKIIFPVGLAIWNLEITLRFKVFFAMTTYFAKHLNYATKVWIIGVLGGSVMLILYFLIVARLSFSAEDFVAWGVLLGAVLFYSFIFSIPSWGLLWLCTRLVNRLSWLEISKKWLLFGVATLLTILLLAFFVTKDVSTVDNINRTLPHMLSYWSSITFGIFYFKLQKPEPQVPILPLDEFSQP